MTHFNKIILILFASLLIIFINCDSTKYCPSSHKINYDWKCRILDKMVNKVLIEHHNLDNGKLLLSIYQNGNSIWIVHPYSKMEGFNTSLDKNNIKFDTKNDSFLIVNGIDFKIMPCEK